ncbi:unnamed protein product [Amoebophrya sp. A120]|nr:unnamed protein product [Amoebophrya sp. A120]|eukprot:GSA120T00008934001.1
MSLLRLCAVCCGGEKDQATSSGGPVVFGTGNNTSSNGTNGTSTRNLRASFSPQAEGEALSPAEQISRGTDDDLDFGSDHDTDNPFHYDNINSSGGKRSSRISFGLGNVVEYEIESENENAGSPDTSPDSGGQNRSSFNNGSSNSFALDPAEDSPVLLSSNSEPESDDGADRLVAKDWVEMQKRAMAERMGRNKPEGEQGPDGEKPKKQKLRFFKRRQDSIVLPPAPEKGCLRKSSAYSADMESPDGLAQMYGITPNLDYV